jgi:hypothetical protein
MERLIPDQVQVLGVEGIGTGFGLSLGNRLLKRITSPQDAPEIETPVDDEQEDSE